MNASSNLLDQVENFPLSLKSVRSIYFDNQVVAYQYPVSNPLICYEGSRLTANPYRSWTEDQNKVLLQLVEQQKQKESSISWSEIAERLKKTPQDCLSHYYNVCDPSLNKSDWTAEEEKQLLRIAERHSYHNWHLISEELGTKRTPIACLKHYQQTLNSDLIKSSEWTLEEDGTLKEALEKYGVGEWQHIATCLPGRSAAQCLNRYRKSFLCQENIVSGAWTEEEERRLFLAAYAYDVPMLDDLKKSVEDRNTLLGKQIFIFYFGFPFHFTSFLCKIL
jgi:hypothetical protein